MNLLKIITALTILLLTILAAPLRSEKLIQAASSGTLEQRWKTAQDQINSHKMQNVWIAYSIEQLMGENEFIGSFYSSRKKYPTLRETLTGKKQISKYGNSDDDVRKVARETLIQLRSNEPERQVMKEVAILFGYKNAKLSAISVSTIDLQFNLEGRSLVWLGPAADSAESIRFLQSQYPKNTSPQLQEDLISAIGIHKDPQNVIAALLPILKKGSSTKLRAAAGFWIANQDDPSALKVLIEHIQSEVSEDVIDETLVGISDMTVPESTEALTEWTSPKYNSMLREKAIFWLGQKTSNALPTLEKVAMEDPDLEIREKAIFSLSEIENEEKTAALIRIARNHRDPKTRKEAIFWLSQNYSKEAGLTLKEFAEKDPDYEVQKHAIFALSELDNGAGVDQLIQLAKSHKNPKIRKEAIFWLGECDDPRAEKALLDIIENDQK